MTKPLSIAELAAMAAASEDQTVVETSTFTNEPIPAGRTIGRFIEYIETGKHPQPDYAGKKKPDADRVRLTFELLHPKKNIHEYEVEGEKRVRADRVSISIAKKLSDKAKFKKLFNAMSYGRDETKHLAQCLGEAFIITVYHNVVKVDGKDVTYVNLDSDGVYGISAPFIVDPLEDTKTLVPVQEALSPTRLFLWSNPTQETWDSLFIDGTRERKLDGGATEQVSKNWLQETILSAKNYEGSPLAALLGGVADLPTEETDPDIVTQDEVENIKAEKPVAAKPKSAAKPADKPAAAKAAKPAKGAADDALAALGLV